MCRGPARPRAYLTATSGEKGSLGFPSELVVVRLASSPPDRYHHTAVDTVDHVAPEQLQLNAANLAVWAYTIANLPELLPRGNDPAPPDPRKGASSSSGGASTQTIVAAVVGSLFGAVLFVAGVSIVVLGRRGRGPLQKCLGSWGDADPVPAYASLSKVSV